MRRIALAMLSTVTVVSLSGCGLPAVVELVKGKDDESSSSTSSEAAAPTTSASSKSSSTKSSSTKTSSTKSSSTKSSTEKTRTVEIPQEQQNIIFDALTPLVKAHVTNPNTDKMTGKIRFDKDMKPTSFALFKLNDKSITPDPAAKAEAEKVFEQLSGTPKEDRFSELEFTFSNNQVEANAYYPNK